MNFKKSSIFLSIIFLFLIPTNGLAQGSVNLHEGPTIGGVQQWVGATSKDSASPLLLFLHGGPGFSSRAYSKKFIKQLKNDFIIAQWDQRGTGITKAWSPDAELGIELMQKDLEEVIDYLLNTLNKEKLFLVGFSWGNVLGIEYALNHPEKLYAYISVSGLTNGINAETKNLDWLKAQAQQEGNQVALEELSTITIPFSSWEELYFQRKWASYFSSDAKSVKGYPKKLFKDWSQEWMQIFNEALNINHTELITTLHCPFYAFLSKRDHVANYEVSSSFVNQLKAQKKAIIWFDNSLHEIPSEEPKKFSAELLKIKAETFN